MLTDSSNRTYHHISISGAGGPAVLELRQSALPEPGPGQVRLRVEAAGVSFADTLVRLVPRPPGDYPLTPGYEAAGLVDQVGPGVRRFRPGQRLLRVNEDGRGGYAVVVIDAAHNFVPVPDRLASDTAVCLGLNGVMAYQMVRRLARVSRGEQVLVHAAAGGVGHLIVELCLLAGAHVYGACSANKRLLVEQIGAVPLDYRSEDIERRLLQAHPDGLDVVFDCTGGESLARSFRLLRPTGRLISYGALSTSSNGVRDDASFHRHQEDPLPWSPLDLIRNSRLLAGYAFYCWKTEHPHLFRHDLATMLDLAAEGSLQPIIAKRFPLTEVRQAHELIDSGAVAGKIVLITNPT